MVHNLFYHFVYICCPQVLISIAFNVLYCCYCVWHRFDRELRKVHRVAQRESVTSIFIDAQRLPLYRLYREIIRRGGFDKCVQAQFLGNVCTALNISPSSEVISELRKAYSQHLSTFESFHFFRVVSALPMIVESEVSGAIELDSERPVTPKPQGPIADNTYHGFIENTFISDDLGVMRLRQALLSGLDFEVKWALSQLLSLSTSSNTLLTRSAADGLLDALGLHMEVRI
jgi:hypothetical protein